MREEIGGDRRRRRSRSCRRRSPKSGRGARGARDARRLGGSRCGRHARRAWVGAARRTRATIDARGRRRCDASAARRAQSAQRDARTRRRARARRLDRPTPRAASRAMPVPPMRVEMGAAWDARHSSTTPTTRTRLDAGGDRLLGQPEPGASGWRFSAPCASSARTAPAPRRGRARGARSPGSRSSAGMGEIGEALARIAPGDPRVVGADELEALWPALASRLAPDAVILLKASRGVRLERLRIRRHSRRVGRKSRHVAAYHPIDSRPLVVLYHFLLPLRSASFFNIFNYISFRAAGAAVTALCCRSSSVRSSSAALRHHAVHQVIREGTPDTPRGEGRRRRRWAA